MFFPALVLVYLCLKIFLPSMWPKNKKFLWFVLGIGALGFLIFGVNYIEDISYEGDDSIRFLEPEYSNFESLIGAKPFKNKILYIDLWFSSCPPCIKELKNPPRLKEHLKDQDEVVFLYLSHRTRHPNTLQLWKNAIQKYDLKGWHYMMSRDFENNLWAELSAEDASIAKGYPRYLIIDNTSGYRNYDAPRPSHVEEVLAIIEPLLD